MTAAARPDRPFIVSAPSADVLATRVAAETIRVCRERQAGGAIPCLVLTGGSMGRASLIALASHPERDAVDWLRVRFLWGDERWVPAGDPERNDRLADDTLFAAVGTDPGLVHRVAGSDSGLGLDEAAARYAEIVDSVGPIDVALNGVGPDGHICSLFPGREELLQDDDTVPSAIPVRDSPKPPPERVTLSLPVVRAADRVWLLAAGAEKRSAVEGILDPDTERPLPAALAHGGAETVLWVDDAAFGATAFR